jgi:RNA polymerase sigma factor (TIGR02999 family)
VPDRPSAEKPPPSSDEVTRLLGLVRAGDPDAVDRLMPLVYDSLRQLAKRALGKESGPSTLVATDLVHEAYLKLVGSPLAANDRAHFLAIAARAMRQVLIERARKRKAEKRGGIDRAQVTLSDGVEARAVDTDELLALDGALDTLSSRQRQVVELRFFAGLSEAEIAEGMGLSVRTVRREWVQARAWLYQAMYPDTEGTPP